MPDDEFDRLNAEYERAGMALLEEGLSPEERIRRNAVWQHARLAVRAHFDENQRRLNRLSADLMTKLKSSIGLS